MHLEMHKMRMRLATLKNVFRLYCKQAMVTLAVKENLMSIDSSQSTRVCYKDVKIEVFTHAPNTDFVRSICKSHWSPRLHGKSSSQVNYDIGIHFKVHNKKKQHFWKTVVGERIWKDVMKNATSYSETESSFKRRQAFIVDSWQLHRPDYGHDIRNSYNKILPRQSHA